MQLWHNVGMSIVILIGFYSFRMHCICASGPRRIFDSYLSYSLLESLLVCVLTFVLCQHCHYIIWHWLWFGFWWLLVMFVLDCFVGWDGGVYVLVCSVLVFMCWCWWLVWQYVQVVMGLAGGFIGVWSPLFLFKASLS